MRYGVYKMGVKEKREPPREEWQESEAIGSGGSGGGRGRSTPVLPVYQTGEGEVIPPIGNGEGGLSLPAARRRCSIRS